MDANQLAEALARAVEAAKPAAEYCLLAKQDHWWTVCMTKAEWSGWMQAIGAVIALLVAIAIPYIQTRHAHAKNFEVAKQCLTHALGVYLSLQTHVSLMGRTASTLHLGKATLETLTASLREVRASDLPQGSHVIWFPAVASIEQFKARVDAAGTPVLPDERIDDFLKGYIRLAEDYLKAFLKHDPRILSKFKRPFRR